MRNVFLANINAPDQIRQVLAELVHSPEFAASSGAKFKTPFEFVISLLRAIAVPINPSARLNQILTQMGDPRYDWGPPNGRPDVSGPWMSNGSLLSRWNAAEQILVPATAILQDNWDGLFGAVLRDNPNSPVNLVNSVQAVTRPC